jgi:hypothetical protein
VSVYHGFGASVDLFSIVENAAVAIATFSLAVIAGFSTWFVNKYFGIEARALAARIWRSPTADQVENKELRKIAGWFSLDCGHVRHREDADRAIACARDAFKTKRPLLCRLRLSGT